jgi:hypothetical protein
MLKALCTLSKQKARTDFGGLTLWCCHYRIGDVSIYRQSLFRAYIKVPEHYS